MPGLDRFKWIPMIVKAYNQAVRATQAQRRAAPPPDARGGAGEAARDAGGVSGPPAREFTHRTANRPTAGSHDRPPVRPAPAASTASARPRGSVRRKSPASARSGNSPAPGASAAYAKVLQELHETQEKLAQLEATHQQLTRMHAELQAQLNDLLQRVGNRPSRTGESYRPNPQETARNLPPLGPTVPSPGASNGGGAGP
ncbi:hypothetical protein [Alicyclobacillus macrosporangiidus]|uniref:Uncharacterized protein n=1 Tax=Alicyclobacillus macrosporangiidus TaxID=392015 RepID=A0A1I7FI68_9BACL|nr:hypothetical protein [Alicyclobacillus macrosporangiidus]SFU35854.1 hypothetical protein SAMN05421543_101268 [Alicyclobacillus macrosporangiidus]